MRGRRRGETRNHILPGLLSRGTRRRSEEEEEPARAERGDGSTGGGRSDAAARISFPPDTPSPTTTPVPLSHGAHVLRRSRVRATGVWRARAGRGASIAQRSLCMRPLCRKNRRTGGSKVGWYRLLCRKGARLVGWYRQRGVGDAPVLVDDGTGGSGRRRRPYRRRLARCPCGWSTRRADGARWLGPQARPRVVTGEACHPGGGLAARSRRRDRDGVGVGRDHHRILPPRRLCRWRSGRGGLGSEPRNGD